MGHCFLLMRIIFSHWKRFTLQKNLSCFFLKVFVSPAMPSTFATKHVLLITIQSFSRIYSFVLSCRGWWNKQGVGIFPDFHRVEGKVIVK